MERAHQGASKALAALRALPCPARQEFNQSRRDAFTPRLPRAGGTVVSGSSRLVVEPLRHGLAVRKLCEGSTL